ncbi:MAG: aminoglycoside phosphotransferase family protein [Betaproteobacteria bacterium]
MTPPDDAVLAADTDTYAAIETSVNRMGLASADSPMVLTPLTGGVSSDIYLVHSGAANFCVKRALPQLKVAAEWRAPVERNRWEVEWMRVASTIAPGAVPAILGEDRVGGAFAMAYLPPEEYPVWKTLLMTGHIDAGVGAAVGDLLGRIHAATADQADMARRFPTDDIFYAIRLEPYLVATGRAQSDVAARMTALVATTQANKRVLVHGDFSPKNILIGADGPVILDAECAWYGDPAFDVAFVLNHLLLKGAWAPASRPHYLEVFLALADAYVAHVRWESPEALEARCAALLPALMLARVDGKSPAEYLTFNTAKDEIRRFARQWLLRPGIKLRPLVQAWAQGASRE